jgi:uncharacterized Zn-binding protein involved in type VI secretion
MRRYLITLDSPTSAGGRVTSAGSGLAVAGKPIALEGDSVACPACGGVGRILCVGPRIPETWHGRHLALENDLCTCRCVPPPRLLASQTVRSQVLKDTGHALSQAMDPAPPPRQGGAGTRFQLVDAHTGTPLAHREYALVRESGRLEFGRSDELGRTHPLASWPGSQRHEVVDIYL